MIPFHFDYYRPDTPEAAAGCFLALRRENKNPVYYSGGSEIISMSRVNSIQPGAVIDLKAIPACGQLEITDKKLVIGAAVTLSRLAESGLFPFLGTTVKRIADHTNQCRITVGGNVCGSIIYREAVLPLLLCECLVMVQQTDGKTKTVPISRVFDGRMRLGEGEFAAAFIIDEGYLSLPYFHCKKTKHEKIDYPLLTVAAHKRNGRLSAAFSGVCEFPFRSGEIDNALNADTSPGGAAQRICKLLPAPPLGNLAGSTEYRLFVLENTVRNILAKAEEI